MSFELVNDSTGVKYGKVLWCCRRAGIQPCGYVSSKATEIAPRRQSKDGAFDDNTPNYTNFHSSGASYA